MKKILFVFLAVFTISACQKQNNQLDIYLWEDILPKNVINSFESSDIKINSLSYKSNEELYSNVRFMYQGQYDIIMPSYYMVSLMRKKNILSTIDIDRLKNINNVINVFLAQPYKTANQYSIPYLAGSIGIIINTKYVDENDCTSWNCLWNSKYAGKIIINNDMRDVFGIALKSLGYSINSMNENEIKESYNKLKLLFPNIKLASYLEVADKLLNGEYYMGMLYQGDAYLITKSNPDFKFIIPQEGSIFWIDCLSIPKAGNNINSAYRFIDYLLLPETVSQIVEYTGSIPVINSNIITPYLSTDMRKQYNDFFDDENFKNMELQQDVGTYLQLYAKYWDMLIKNKY